MIKYEWISVNDQLPNEYQCVLVCNVNKESDEYDVEPDVLFAIYAPCSKGCCDAEFEVDGNFWIDSRDVTHWTPLPPKAEKIK